MFRCKTKRFLTRKQKRCYVVTTFPALRQPRGSDQRARAEGIFLSNTLFNDDQNEAAYTKSKKQENISFNETKD